MQEAEKNKKTPKWLIIIAIMALIIILLLMTMCGNKQIKAIYSPVSLDENQGEYIPPDKDEIKRSNNITFPGWGVFNIKAGSKKLDKGIKLNNPVQNIWYECPGCGQYLSYTAYGMYKEDFLNTKLTEQDFNQLVSSKKMHCEHCHKDYEVTSGIKRCYYMTFALYIKNNGEDELLYQSGLVAPGNFIQKMELSKSLLKGSYNAYVKIQPYYDDKATPANGGVVELIVNAK